MISYEQALNKAAAYCSKAERAPKEVAQKLLDWEVSEEDVERILQCLHEEHFLDERRFVHAFVNDKFIYEHWGRIKIAYALRQKGIQGVLVQNTMEDVIDPDQYLEVLTSILRTKVRGMSSPLDQRDRAKVYRFAAQRGFESEVIGRALRNLNIPEEE